MNFGCNIACLYLLAITPVIVDGFAVPQSRTVAATTTSLRVSYDLDLTDVDLSTPAPKPSKVARQRKATTETPEPIPAEASTMEETPNRRGGKKTSAKLVAADPNPVTEAPKGQPKGKASTKKAEPAPTVEETPKKRQRNTSPKEEPPVIESPPPTKQKTRKDPQVAQPLTSVKEKPPQG
eukprot:CAMPEP_0168256010 /NCGR_PEP_ID=MMETSP0141_2-20121125/5592_1 /TAXON_ID=44445 /ORGANISM="Pseudo-nitzschia australis, Strain 10249 10 AB" /LENGTH=179 /DNA_ID=CAMNT_0008192613 /DNA_START=598 /DNA_END=1133 /DNA_ORIENTATION=+